jgi:hypothetical protein
MDIRDEFILIAGRYDDSEQDVQSKAEQRGI